MSYKVKSIVYFACFVAAAIAYYTSEQEITKTNTMELAEADATMAKVKSMGDIE
ncbi:MAG: hypothetical protein AAFO99_02050 [Bacteroidota bacterium]